MQVRMHLYAHAPICACTYMRMHIYAHAPLCTCTPISDSITTASGKHSRLVAGAIPVIDYHPSFDELWAGLPVVRVRNWSHVTPAFLEGEWQRVERETQAGAYDMRKVYWPFWLERLTRWTDR